MTPRDLCTRALRRVGAIGVGQTPLAEDINDAFSTLNDMLGQWAQKRYVVPNLIDVYFTGTGAASYSIGTGATVNTPRPDRLEAAFVRMLSGGRGIDYPLEVIEAREDWNAIPFKTMAGFPTSVFYDSGFPIGTLYVNPLPSSQYEIHLTLKQPIVAFGNLSDTVNLPPEYHEALLNNLAVRLFADYGLQVRPDVVALAKASLNTIRNSNTQIATLKMPAGMPGVRRGWGGGVGSIGFTIGSGAVGGGTVPGGGGGGVVIPPSPATTSVLGVAVLGQMVLGSDGLTI
jgi:hypothetical protein